jgi:RNA polymerase sigma-70 factor (ECF subfamily)
MSDPARTVEAVWRVEGPRVLARVARLLGDVALAEEVAQDALVAALEAWPRTGVPTNPGAWLVTAAKHRAVDLLRRSGRWEARSAALAAEPPPTDEDPTALLDDPVRDDRLRLVFVACHPALPPDARVALALRLVAGLTTAEIARAYLQPEATVGQRISRAKARLAEARVPFEVPAAAELPERLAAVLHTVYLLFSEGHAATSGAEWMRPALCAEALRLGRVLAALLPGEPEVHGLLALMELQASRTAARSGPDGAPVLLADQDRSRWDRAAIGRGLAALARAGDGPYACQARIAAHHARARSWADTDWEAIVADYDGLLGVAPSAVAAVNRAVAVGKARGPEAGLAALPAPDATLARWAPWHAVRGDLLAALGRGEEAREAFTAAAARTDNERERAVLLARAGPGPVS